MPALNVIASSCMHDLKPRKLSSQAKGALQAGVAEGSVTPEASLLSDPPHNSAGQGFDITWCTLICCHLTASTLVVEHTPTPAALVSRRRRHTQPNATINKTHWKRPKALRVRLL